MFGENLTVQGLDEQKIYIGDQYEIGGAIIELSEPRDPCYKLGIRFGTQKVLKHFINQPHCGVYVRVLQPGLVCTGDEMRLIKRVQQDFTMARIFWLRYHATLTDIPEVKQAIQLETLAESAKNALQKRLTFLGNI